MLAAAFFAMSRGRLFPLPLLWLHGALVLYNLYAMLTGAKILWVALFLNRAFELALVYTGACAAWRIARLAAREKQTR